MVVAQNDIGAPTEGFADDQSTIPFGGEQQFPLGSDDAAPSGEDVSGDMATEPDDPLAVLESLAPEQREQVEQTYRQRVSEELEAAHTERLAKYQEIKDREVANALAARDSAGMALGLTKQWLAQYFTEVANGDRQPDPRDYVVFEQQRDQYIRAEVQKRQQAQSGATSFEQGSRERMQQKLQKWSQDDAGNVVTDLTKDAELNALAERMFAAHRANRNGEFNDLYQQHVELAHAKRAAAIVAARTNNRQQAPSRQQARGPQVVARGGTPAGPPDFKSAIEAVKAANPNLDYNAVFIEAQRLVDSQ